MLTYPQDDLLANLKKSEILSIDKIGSWLTLTADWLDV